MIYPKIQSYRDSECLQFSSEFATLVAPYDLESLHLDAHSTTIHDIAVRATQAYKPMNEADLSAMLASLDLGRDGVIVYIDGAFRNLVRHWDESIVDLAQPLYRRWARYGKRIYELSYRAETATIDAITAEFLGDELLVADITTLNLHTSFVELARINAEFTQVTLQRTMAKSEKESASFRDDLFNLAKEIRQFYSNVEALQTVFTTLDYEPLSVILSQLAEEYNEVLTRRLAGNSKSEDISETPIDGALNEST